jgi:hypothetical protein
MAEDLDEMMNTRNGGRSIGTEVEFCTQAAGLEWLDRITTRARAAAPWLCIVGAALVAWCWLL